MQYEEKYGNIIHSDNTIAHTQVWRFDTQEEMLRFWLGIIDEKKRYSASLTENVITKTIYVTVGEYLSQRQGEEE